MWVMVYHGNLERTTVIPLPKGSDRAVSQRTSEAFRSNRAYRNFDSSGYDCVPTSARKKVVLGLSAASNVAGAVGFAKNLARSSPTISRYWTTRVRNINHVFNRAGWLPIISIQIFPWNRILDGDLLILQRCAIWETSKQADQCFCDN